jgi:hypothetical protein
VQAILKQNGLELSSSEPLGDNWGQVRSIRLLVRDDENGDSQRQLSYQNWYSAAQHWTPGQVFDLIVDHVPTVPREGSVEELLPSLDPDRVIPESTRGDSRNIDLLLDTDELESLEDMRAECARRFHQSPRHVDAEADAFSGVKGMRGYRVMNVHDLMSEMKRITESNTTTLLESDAVLHVMDSLVSPGCLVIDMTNGGKDLDAAHLLADLWYTTQQFFSTVVDEDMPLPPITAVVAGRSHGRMGYTDYGEKQFLETRLDRATGKVLPVQIQSLLVPQGCRSMEQSFNLLATIGKSIVRVVVAASTLLARANSPPRVPKHFDALVAADRVVEELLDDGRPLASSKLPGSSDQHVQEHTEGSASMSPHRLGRYPDKEKTPAREAFGAHTDTSFVTIVPVADVPGLEVYDETTGKWYRPELAAKRHYEELVSISKDMTELPWHARYVVVLPGELLQLLARQEVLAAVHRVVTMNQGQTRYTAPVLLRHRSGTVLDAERYWGKASSALLKECDGMRMDAIYDAME